MYCTSARKMASNDNDTPVSKDENQPGTSKTQQIKVKKVDSDSSDIEVLNIDFILYIYIFICIILKIFHLN